jgi:hypothetical protein
VSRYRFIEAEKVEERSVNRACAVLEVSRAAYYEWRKQEPSARAQQDRELAEKVKAIFCRSRQWYGAPRVHRELGRQGLRCWRKLRYLRLGVGQRRPLPRLGTATLQIQLTHQPGDPTCGGSRRPRV